MWKDWLAMQAVYYLNPLEVADTQKNAFCTCQFDSLYWQSSCCVCVRLCVSCRLLLHLVKVCGYRWCMKGKNGWSCVLCVVRPGPVSMD